jgi:hypothetical protein
VHALAKKRRQGFADVVIFERYKEGDPRFCLPSICFLLGREVIKSMK